MPPKVKKDDDEDLKDLLSNEQQQRTSTTVPGYYAGPKMSLYEFCTSYISMMCFYYPTCCGTFACCVVIGFLVLLSTFMVNPMQTYGDIGHDHSNIQSKYDLDMGKIDHWCLGGGNDRCPCEDPLQPVGRVNHKSWIQAYKANLKLVAAASYSKVDVAFLGESIIEEMTGRWMGKHGRSPLLVNLERKFRSHFDKLYGGGVDGVALGIAGDSAANVLWRLLHGELADGFDPSVWWISLGNNDLARMQCSEEVVVIGILRVVEEILQQRPNAKIVINSVFPMSNMRGGAYPVISDYKDSFMNVPPANGARSLDEDAEQANDEAAEVEERERDAKAHVERLFKRQSQSSFTLKDSEHVRRNRLGTFRAARKPLWTSIRAINRQLQKFATNHPDRVAFFDASEIFIVPDPSGRKSTMQANLISLRGHLTEEGFEQWEARVLQFLEPILQQQAIEYGTDERTAADDDYINAHLAEDGDDFYGTNIEAVNADDEIPPPPGIQEIATPPLPLVQEETQGVIEVHDETHEVQREPMVEIGIPSLSNNATAVVGEQSPSVVSPTSSSEVDMTSDEPLENATESFAEAVSQSTSNNTETEPKLIQDDDISSSNNTVPLSAYAVNDPGSSNSTTDGNDDDEVTTSSGDDDVTPN